MIKAAIYDGTSDLTRYRVVDMVYDGRPARMLFSGKSAPQSGIATDDNPELLFNYNQRLLEIAASVQPQSVLMIGGGVMTLPMALLARLDGVTVDVVEIDPLLPQLATDYFGLQADRRLTILVQDGRNYIDHCSATYDMIIIDAFAEYTVPRSLLTVEATRQYARCLKPDGIVAVNFIARYHTYKTTLAHQLQASFDSTFEQVDLYPADHSDDKRSEQNLLLVASQSPDVALEYLQSAPVSLLFTPEDAALHDQP